MYTKSFFTLAATVLAVAMTGCASRSATPVTTVADIEHSPVCDRSWQLQDAVQLEPSPRPLVQLFDAGSPCLAETSGVAVTYAAYRLPAYTGNWRLRVESHLHGRSLFAPELVLLDENRRVVRHVPHERFVMRGKQLQATVFFHDENAGERYLLVRSATHAAGHGQVRVESSYFILPIFTGLIPFVYMQGTEREREFVLAHSGVVKIFVEEDRQSTRVEPGYDVAAR